MNGIYKTKVSIRRKLPYHNQFHGTKMPIQNKLNFRLEGFGFVILLLNFYIMEISQLMSTSLHTNIPKTSDVRSMGKFNFQSNVVSRKNNLRREWKWTELNFHFEIRQMSGTIESHNLPHEYLKTETERIYSNLTLSPPIIQNI